VQQGASSDIELRPGVVQHSAYRGAYIGASSYTFNMVWPQKCTYIARLLQWGKIVSTCFRVDCKRGSESQHCAQRKKIRLVEGNSKCRHLNKFTSKGTFQHVFICLRPITRCDVMALGLFCSGNKRPSFL
jgi:hypothetical protein